MTPYTVISLGEVVPGVQAVEVHRVHAQPGESAYDMVERLDIKRHTHIFQGHAPFSDEPVPDPTLWALTWEVDNANDRTGILLYTTQQSAIDVAIEWMLSSEFISQEEVADCVESFKEDGHVAAASGDWQYTIEPVAPR